MPSGALFLICPKLMDQTAGTSRMELLQEWNNNNKSVFVFLCCVFVQIELTEGTSCFYEDVEKLQKSIRDFIHERWRLWKPVLWIIAMRERIGAPARLL